ncbi:MAG: PspA/IM30 family protein, partial [Eubacterium sp.]
NAKAETAGIIANESAARRRLAEVSGTVEKYVHYAEEAMKQNNEIDARSFLAAKAEAAAKLPPLESDCQRAAEISQKMREMIAKLESEIHETEDKIQALSASLASAKIQEKSEGIGGFMNRENSFDDLCDIVEKRVDTAEARSSLDVSKPSELEALEQKYAQDKDGDSVDDELLQLKNKMNPAE